jgi:hypothetical protein
MPVAGLLDTHIGDTAWADIQQSEVDKEVFVRLQAVGVLSHAEVMTEYEDPQLALASLCRVRKGVIEWLGSKGRNQGRILNLIHDPPQLNSLGGAKRDEYSIGILLELYRRHRDALFYVAQMPLSADYIDNDQPDRLEYLYSCCVNDLKLGVKALVVRPDALHVMHLKGLQSIVGVRSKRKHFAFMMAMDRSMGHCDVRGQYRQERRQQVPKYIVDSGATINVERELELVSEYVRENANRKLDLRGIGGTPLTTTH